MSRRIATGIAVGLLLLVSRSAGTPSAERIEQGAVHFVPVRSQAEIPAAYRLDTHEFPFRLEHRRALPESGLDVYELTFPSAVTTHCIENNTVYAE